MSFEIHVEHDMRIDQTLPDYLSDWGSVFRISQLPLSNGFAHEKLWVLYFKDSLSGKADRRPIRITKSQQGMLNWLLAQSNIERVLIRRYSNVSDDICVQWKDGEHLIRYDVYGAGSHYHTLTRLLQRAIEDVN